MRLTGNSEAKAFQGEGTRGLEQEGQWDIWEGPLMLLCLKVNVKYCPRLQFRWKLEPLSKARLWNPLYQVTLDFRP